MKIILKPNYKQLWINIVALKINKKDLDKLQKDINKAIVKSMDQTFVFFKMKTPIDTGNARSKTTYDQRTLTIRGAYPYAERLDNGYSRQAPRGMTEPSLVFLKAKLRNEFAKI